MTYFMTIAVTHHQEFFFTIIELKIGTNGGNIKKRFKESIKSRVFPAFFPSNGKGGGRAEYLVWKP